MRHPTADITPEDVITIYCTPQSIFRVRPATRCSSTLTGTSRLVQSISHPIKFPSYSGHSAPILCASFSPTGNLLATGSGDATARLWDLNTETPSHVLSGHQGWVLCVEWEPMERKLATGGHDSLVRLWDPKSGKPIGDALKGHTKWITSLAWEPIHMYVQMILIFPCLPYDHTHRNPTTPRLASSSKDSTVRVWSTALRKTLFTLGGHSASVNVVRWGGSGGPAGVLYTASSDRTVKVWDAVQGKQLFTLNQHAHWVTTLTLNTDFVTRTGPFDHTGKKPSSDEEGM